MRGFIIAVLKCGFLSLILGSGLSAFATHYRAGEIIYTLLSPLTYDVQVITYTKFSGVSASADRDSIDISWGDGTSQLISRVNGVDADGDGVPEGEVIFDDIKKNVYRGRHQYPGIRPFYVISILDPNRIDNIINISGGASVNVPFFIEDTLKFFDIPSLGYNNSPVLLNPPIDFANINDTFYHNPNAYDLDGDSLFFRLIPPKQNVLSSVPAYQYPNQIIPGANNRFNINSATGELLWGTPQRVGIYNIAILIEEYRNSIQLGTLIRDMQIIVNDYPNDPPQIDDVRDTCVIAGTPIGVIIRATDPQLSQTVTMRATGGPFEVPFNKASFVGPPGNAAYDTFYWNTDCSHIRSQFYSVVINASDNFSVGSTRVPLVDLETWLIRVIAPAPENLLASASGNAINLSWQNPYRCSSTPNFRSFSVWRKIGSNPFIPDSCETGLEGRGYVKIADNIRDYNYRDADVVRGQLYCYRILAHFSKLSPNGLVEYDNAVSIPSNESCAELKKDVPVILHVDVVNTDSINGKIFVDWSLPRIPDLDTIQNPGRYRFELKRAPGIGGTAFTNIRSYSSSSFEGLRVDTFHTDSLINTVQFPYTYTLDFFAETDSLIGTCDPASSVYLSVFQGDKKIRLTWNETVPWTNYTYHIYRSSDTGVTFSFIDSTTTQGYSDTGLNNGFLYCYYVEAFGSYSSSGFISPLRNKSQKVCAIPIDTVPPCPPNFQVSNDCGIVEDNLWTSANFVNRLKWRIDPTCSADLRRYRIYFKASGNNTYILIDSTSLPSDSSYSHDLSFPGINLAGCYQVKAVDSIGNESDTSFIVCIDNCPVYRLPNVFTPNGDGYNDFFKPFIPYRFVTKIDIEIFDRWGNKVFKTDNPDILWDGKDQKTGKPLSEGVYFYQGTYTELRLDGEHTKPLPSRDNGAGFIHLMRDK